MSLPTITVLLLFSTIACASQESQTNKIPVDVAERIPGSVYLVPIFVTTQQEYTNPSDTVNNRIDEEHYEKATPLHRLILSYPSAAENQNGITNNEQTSSEPDDVHDRDKRSPGGRRRGGHGGGGGGGSGGGEGGGGGRGSSGSWSMSSSSSSSGSFGSGSGGGRGHGGGQGSGRGGK